VTTKDRWREYVYQLGISLSDKDRAKQQAFKRATEDLLEAKRIGTWGEFFWVITE